MNDGSNKLLAALTSYAVSNDTEKMNETKPLKYIMAGNGIHEVRSTAVLSSVVKTDSAAGLPHIQDGISLNVPKIPFGVFNKIYTFMSTVYEKDKTESTAMVFYNKERNSYFPWIPLQQNAGASSHYKRDDDAEYSRMCSENILVMVAHSHPWKTTTSPGPSSTDENDEKEGILYMIVGNVEGVPTTYVSTCPGGKRTSLRFFDVFQNPLSKVDGEPKDSTVSRLLDRYVPEAEIFSMFVEKQTDQIPASWYERCTHQTYQVHQPSIYTSSWGRENNGWSDYRTNGHKYYYNGKSYTEQSLDRYDSIEYGESEYDGLAGVSWGKSGGREYEKTLSQTSLNSDDGPEGSEGLGYEDILDEVLNLDNRQLGKMIHTLCVEGKGGLISKYVGLAKNAFTKTGGKKK